MNRFGFGESTKSTVEQGDHIVTNNSGERSHIESNVNAAVTNHVHAISGHKSETLNTVASIKKSAVDVAKDVGMQSKKSQDTSTRKVEFKIGYHSIGILDDEVDIPSYVKEHYTTLTFPEKLMLMLMHVERECAKRGKNEEDESVGWIMNGRAFVIRNKERFTKTWLPLFFIEAKFSSFTRKLYRWGFRKMSVTSGEYHGAEQHFGNENFQRNDKSLLSRMRSVTAQKLRSEAAELENARPPSCTHPYSFQSSRIANANNLENSQYQPILQSGSFQILPQTIPTEQLLHLLLALSNLLSLINSVIQQQQVAHQQQQKLQQQQQQQQQQRLQNQRALQSQQQFPGQTHNSQQLQLQLQCSQFSVSVNSSQQPQIGISKQPADHQSTQIGNLLNQLLLQLGQLSAQQVPISALVAQPTPFVQNITSGSNSLANGIFQPRESSLDSSNALGQNQWLQHVNEILSAESKQSQPSSTQPNYSGNLPSLSQPSPASRRYSNHKSNQQSVIDAIQSLLRNNPSGQSQPEAILTPQRQESKDVQPDALASESATIASQISQSPDQQQPLSELTKILHSTNRNGPSTTSQKTEGANQEKEQLRGILEILQRCSQSRPSPQPAPPH